MHCQCWPPDAMPLLTWNVLGAPEHQRPNFDGFIYIHYAVSPKSAHIIICLLPLGKVWFSSISFNFNFPCPTTSNKADYGVYWGWVNTPDHIVNRLWTKFHDSDDVWNSWYLPDCLYHLSFRRFAIMSPSRRKTCIGPTKFFGPHFWERQPRLFYGRLLLRFAVHRLAKFGWVSFARLRLRCLAMKWNAEFTEDKPIGKYDGRILSRLWTKVRHFDDVGDPL